MSANSIHLLVQKCVRDCKELWVIEWKKKIGIYLTKGKNEYAILHYTYLLTECSFDWKCYKYVLLGNINNQQDIYSTLFNS